LPPGPDPVHLFAENFDVEMWNSDRIMELDGKFRNKGPGGKVLFNLLNRLQVSSVTFPLQVIEITFIST
jgi:hypothetical protein